MHRDFAKQRALMVEEQLRGRGIRDERVLAAFLKVERHRFVSDDVRANAYGDFPLSIGYGQTISQPYIVALMTEKLALAGGEKVLEIGTGSGYQTAILMELGCVVYSIEYVRVLSEKAGVTLGGYGNVAPVLKVGDGSLGWPEYAPFDRILVAAGAPDIPDPLIGQLARGGKMIIPIGAQQSQMLTLVEKKDAGVQTVELCECSFVPLKGAYGWKG